MERLGILDPDEIHLWCLHLVFLPLINENLTCWKNGWIQHPLRSEQNKSPMQLWIEGLNAISETESTVAREIFQVRFDMENNRNIDTCQFKYLSINFVHAVVKYSFPSMSVCYVIFINLSLAI